MPTLATFTQNIILEIKAIAVKEREIKGFEKNEVKLFLFVDDTIPCIQNSKFSSVAQSCSTLCDPMDCSMPGLSVPHRLLEFT